MTSKTSAASLSGSTSLLWIRRWLLSSFLQNRFWRDFRDSNVEIASVVPIELSTVHSTSTDECLSNSGTCQLSPSAESDAWEPFEYQLLYLNCDGNSADVEALRSRLNDSSLLRRYDILTMFPINRQVWELLVSTRGLPRFSRCTSHCGFAIKYHKTLRPGLFVRASIVIYQSKMTQDMNPFLQEAAAIYSELLRRYPRRQVLIDIVGVVIFLPRSVIMGFYAYRRNWLHFTSERGVKC